MGAANPEIIKRRVKIDFESAQTNPWSARGAAFENKLNVLSFLFPAGERFFINSVRNYLPRVTDPVLREQAEQFIYQEAMHTKEHTRSNLVLAADLPYGPAMDRLAKTMLAFHTRTSFKASQLAVTCAMEHFTAILADDLLRRQDEFRAAADPAFATLWLWHAVEETEHKAVCFDVYEHVFGKGFFSYLHRVVMMAMTTLVVALTMGIGFRIVARGERKKDGASSTPAPARPTLSSLMRSISGRLYFDYYRRSFHPWDHDNSDLVAQWKRNYADLGVQPTKVKQLAS